MSPLLKKLLGGAVTFSITAIGLLADVPQAIKNCIEYGPEIMSNPDLWWIVVCALCYGAFFVFISKREKKEEVSNPAFDKYASVANHAQHFLDHCSRLYGDKVLGVFMSKELSIVTPELIRRLYGKKEADKFSATFASFREDNPGDFLATISAYAGYIKAMLIETIDKQLQEQREQLAEQMKSAEPKRTLQ